MYFNNINTDVTETKILKRDSFGQIAMQRGDNAAWTERSWRKAPWWSRWLARLLAAREARALALADNIVDVPKLLAYGPDHLCREWIDGQPMQKAQPRDPDYYRQALRLLRKLHRLGIAHNDLAKEANWLVSADGRPAQVDFQLAGISHRRGRWFRTLAREDLRHLLKHKRSYCPDKLSARQKMILARKALPTRIWMATGKPVYLFVTRKILNWSDREGANDRNAL